MIEDKLISIISSILDIDTSRINLDSLVEDIEEWDSLAHIQIISEIESELGIIIPIEKVSEIISVRDLLSYVK